MRRIMLVLGIVLVVLLWPGRPTRAAPPTGALGVAGDVGLGGLGGRAHATVQSGIDLVEGNLALSLFGRVRFPLQDVSREGRVRGRDWDEPGDYVHILRSVRYQHVFDWGQLAVLEGELLGYTLGHGTLVRDFSNIADADHPHSGISFRLNSRRVGVEAMVDNFLLPSAAALRLSGKPVARAMGFTVGTSLVMDPRAPRQIRLGAGGARAVDSAWNLQAETDLLPFWGLDAEYAIGSEARGQVVPYLDLNTTFHGVGFHLGTTARVPLGRRVALGGQVEYRVGSTGYSPAYFETFYDMERYQSRLSLPRPETVAESERGPKLAGVLAGQHAGHGLLVQAGVEVTQLLQVRLGYSRRPGPDGDTLWARASSTPIDRLDLGLLLVARGLGERGAGGSGLVALAEGHFRLTRYLYALAQYTRTWSLSAETRYFDILQSFNVGVGTSWSG